MVHVLLEAGANVDAAATDGITPLYPAALYGHKRVVRALLDAGADVNAPDPNGCTPLHAAAVNGDEEVVRALLEGGAEVKAEDKTGTTAEQCTRRIGLVTVAEVLRAASKPKHGLSW